MNLVLYLNPMQTLILSLLRVRSKPVGDMQKISPRPRVPASPRPRVSLNQLLMTTPVC
jgi:hypothetical protein